MTYSPEFSLTRREDNTALWVTMPNDGLYNIWDLEDSKVSPDVLRAIISAFYLGVEAQKKVTQQASIKREWNTKDWDDQRG